MTIYDIKEATKEKSPYFFERDAMRFFNQKMKDFKVKKSPLGNIYIYATSYWDDELMGYTFSQFKDDDLLGINLDTKTEESILNYIKEH